MTDTGTPTDVARVARPLATWRLLAGAFVASALGISFLAGGARVDWPIWMFVGAGLGCIGATLAVAAVFVTRRAAHRVTSGTGHATYLLIPVPSIYATAPCLAAASMVFAFATISFCDFTGRTDGSPLRDISSGAVGATMACLFVAILVRQKYRSQRVER